MDKQEDRIRLQAYLARCGVASRRASEELILAGRVQVNGIKVTELGSKVSSSDRVEFDSHIVKPETRLVYLALHKPEGYICSASDTHDRPLALSLLPKDITERVYNVGRLDLRSSGLILFTNDGNFAAKVSHPSAEIEKEYLVDSTVPIPDSMLESFRSGVEVEGEVYRCANVERTGQRSLRIVLIEGKNKEIRRVFSHFHLHAERLHRVRIGRILLGDLKEGQSRSLTSSEIQSLLPKKRSQF
ncbi:pseudouridine synthase [Treponema sp.]